MLHASAMLCHPKCGEITLHPAKAHLSQPLSPKEQYLRDTRRWPPRIEQVSAFCSCHVDPSTCDNLLRAGPPSSNVLYPGAFLRGPRTSNILAAQRLAARPGQRQPSARPSAIASPPETPLARLQGAALLIPDDITSASGNQFTVSRAVRRPERWIRMRAMPRTSRHRCPTMR